MGGYKQKVLMFGWEFPPYNSGGLGVACAGMTKALSAKGTEVSFVLPYKIPVMAPWLNFLFADSKKVFKSVQEMQQYTSGYQSHMSVSERSSLESQIRLVEDDSLIGRVRAYAQGASEIAMNNSHNIIHAHDWLTYLAGVEAKKVSKKPFVAHVHATEFDRSGGDSVNGAVYDIEKAGLDAADVVVTVSGRTKNVVSKKYGIKEDKIKVVYNGAEFNSSTNKIYPLVERLKSNGSKIVLFAGRITIQKGPDYFVSLAEKILKHYKDVYFVVSGSGDMEPQMISEVASRGIADKFIFCGFLRGEELAYVYRASDIYVMPSVSEPFGLLPVEVMLSDTPVLVSKESGVSEILSNALKSHFWDIDDMADKVISVLTHGRLKRHLQENGKVEAKGIHWGKAADSLISLYNSLIPSY